MTKLQEKILCARLTLLLSKANGYFVEKNMDEITDEDMEHPIWLNNWELACFSFRFWVIVLGKK